MTRSLHSLLRLGLILLLSAGHLWAQDSGKPSIPSMSFMDKRYFFLMEEDRSHIIKWSYFPEADTKKPFSEYLVISQFPAPLSANAVFTLAKKTAEEGGANIVAKWADDKNVWDLAYKAHCPDNGCFEINLSRYWMAEGLTYSAEYVRRYQTREAQIKGQTISDKEVEGWLTAFAQVAFLSPWREPPPEADPEFKKQQGNVFQLQALTLMEENFRAAVKLWAKAFALDPGNPTYHMNYGSVLARMAARSEKSDPQSARSVYQEVEQQMLTAIDLFGKGTWKDWNGRQYPLSQCYFVLGDTYHHFFADYPKAAEYYGLALKVFPEHPEAKEQMAKLKGEMAKRQKP